jgi:predicted Zn-dependent protease with MMP-like domain
MDGRGRFEELVAQALAELPDQFRRRLDNVDVVVETWPSRRQLARFNLGPSGTLLGLYEGVPQSKRTRAYGLVPPDRITIFQGPIEAICKTPQAIQKKVREVVIHEIAHHFGIGDGRLKELGL